MSQLRQTHGPSRPHGPAHGTHRAPCPTFGPSACFDFGYALGQRVAGQLGWMAAEPLDPGYPCPPHCTAVPEKHAGWSCFSLDANYIPPIPRAPTHALLREKRKKKMRKGSWGTETDPKTTALLRSTRMTKAPTSVSSFDSEHRARTEQGAADPGDQEGEGLKRCRQGTHVSPGQELRDCRDPSVVSCPCFNILHEY